MVHPDSFVSRDRRLHRRGLILRVRAGRAFAGLGLLILVCGIWLMFRVTVGPSWWDLVSRRAQNVKLKMADRANCNNCKVRSVNSESVTHRVPKVPWRAFHGSGGFGSWVNDQKPVFKVVPPHLEKRPFAVTSQIGRLPVERYK